jgi:hypothetical protein
MGYLRIAEAEPDRVKVVPRSSVASVAEAVWQHVEPLLARLTL